MVTRVSGMAVIAPLRLGYGIGAGAAAVATGALIGGAIATQNQGYYYPEPRLLLPGPDFSRIFGSGRRIRIF